MNKKQLIVDLRLQFIITVFLILFSSHAVYAQKAADVENREPVLVADQYYAWDCPEGNLGISISAKFNSRDQMEATLSLLKEIGTYQSKKWKLSDVLISADFNANGDVASWKVSGPKPLLLKYLEDLEARYKDKTLFYDFEYSFINFKPTAYWEKEDE